MRLVDIEKNFILAKKCSLGGCNSREGAVILYAEWGNIVPVAAMLGVLLMAGFGVCVILVCRNFLRRGK